MTKPKQADKPNETAEETGADKPNETTERTGADKPSLPSTETTSVLSAGIDAIKARRSGIELAPGITATVTKQVTRPVYKQTTDGIMYILIEGEIRIGNPIQGFTREGEAKMAPAHVADIVNIETGEECIMIFNTVLRTEFDKNYPDHSYIGKTFAVKPGGMKEGSRQKYRTYQILEIAVTVDRSKLNR